MSRATMNEFRSEPTIQQVETSTFAESDWLTRPSTSRPHPHCFHSFSPSMHLLLIQCARSSDVVCPAYPPLFPLVASLQPAVMDRASLLSRACQLSSAAAADSSGSADEARDAVVAAVLRGEWSLPSLISDMASILTSERAETRQCGLRLLNAALAEAAVDTLQLHSKQVDSMAAFFTQRMSDERCVHDSDHAAAAASISQSAQPCLPPALPSSLTYSGSSPFACLSSAAFVKASRVCSPCCSDTARCCL